MYRLLIFLFASILFLSCGHKTNQSPDQAENESDKITHTRSVNGNTLVSNQLPKIEIEVAEEFSFIGKFDFEIIAESKEYPEEIRNKPVAAGERFVFVSADSNRAVNKLFIVQFEGFLPTNDFIYNYNFDEAEYLGQNKYRHNTWFYDSKKLAEENPNNEGAKTRAFLMEKGYQIEDQFMMSRFVGLASDDRKHEIIIYYLEMLQKSTGYTLEEYEKSISKEAADAIRSSLIERSRNSFKITKG